MTDTVFHLRPAALHDLEDVVAFCQACEAAVAGQSFLSTVRLRGVAQSARG